MSVIAPQVPSAQTTPAPSERVRSTLRVPWLRVSQVFVILGAVALWDLAARFDVASDQALPAPGEVFTRLLNLLGSSQLWQEMSHTLISWGVGIAAAVVIAVPLGLLLGSNDFANMSSRFLVDFLRTIPALGLIPLAALMFGTTRASQLLIVIPACVWPMLLQVIYGVRNTDPVALETARSYRLGRLGAMRRIILPSSLPFLATGLRISAIMGMLLAISIELLVLVPGLGRLIAVAQRNGQIVDVYAYTLVAGFLGLAVVLVFTRLERWIIHWHPSQRKQA